MDGNYTNYSNPEVLFVPATLTAVASEKLQKEVEEELKQPDPSEKSVAKLLEGSLEHA